MDKLEKQIQQLKKTNMKKEKPAKKKRMIGIVLLLLVGVIIGICVLNVNKSKIFGNTISKSNEGLRDTILNMESYEAKMEVEVETNKNTNKYCLYQKYASPNAYFQEVLEPENIKNVKMTFDGTNLKIENSTLGLHTIFEQYHYIAENHLFLTTFIEDYKKDQNAKIDEKSEELMLETRSGNENNKYMVYKKLYIDKKTGKPVRMDIQDGNKKTLVHILYNEITINSTRRENVLAFSYMTTQDNI